MSENIENVKVSEENVDEPINVDDVCRKKTTFMDILAVQAIMCLVAAIAFVTVNTFKPDLAADILEIYLEKNAASGSLSRVVEIIVDFLQSTPLNGV